MNYTELLWQLIQQYGLPYAGQLIQKLMEKYGQGVTKEQIEAEHALLLPVPPKSTGEV